jgi:hypothetical protein
MDYMSQSDIEPSLRRFLYSMGRKGREVWVDILTAIAAHCKDFPFTSRTDVHTASWASPGRLSRRTDHPFPNSKTRSRHIRSERVPQIFEASREAMS